jgi:hypothetical protein
MTTFRLILAPIFFLMIGCKKDQVQNIADKGILYDTAYFGTKINIGEWGRFTWVYWGRNADEIFVSKNTQYEGSESYQVDLLTKKSSRIDLAEGFVKGRNFDNSSMLVLGRVNNVYGYYLYHFNTGTYSLLLKVEKMSVNSVNVSGNAVFYEAGDTICPLNSTSCADWSPSVSYFHFIDADSKKIVPLPKKRFHSFSKTGKRTLLEGSPDSIYIFNNDKAMVVDSLKINPLMAFSGQPPRVYFDDETGVVKEFALDNAGEVAIINAKTKDIIQKFRPSVLDPKLKWSVDGSKLYYYTVSGGPSAIGIYDLISKKETIIDHISRTPFNMYLSGDNKKILYQSGGLEYWYIKKVL